MKKNHMLRGVCAGFATVAILAAFALTARPRSNASGEKDAPVAFFLIGDTHLLANKKDNAKLDERSSALASQLVTGSLRRCGALARSIPRLTTGNCVLRFVVL